MDEMQLHYLKAMSAFGKYSDISKNEQLFPHKQAVMSVLEDDRLFKIVKEINEQKGTLSAERVWELYKECGDNATSTNEVMFCMFLECRNIPDALWEKMLAKANTFINFFDKMMTRGIPPHILDEHWPLVAEICRNNFSFLPTNNKLYSQKYHGPTLKYIAEKVNDEKYCPVPADEAPLTVFIKRSSILSHLHPYDSVHDTFNSEQLSDLLANIATAESKASVIWEPPHSQSGKPNTTTDKEDIEIIRSLSEEAKIIASLRNPYINEKGKETISDCYSGDSIKISGVASNKLTTDIFVSALEGLQYQEDLLKAGPRTLNVLMIQKCLDTGKIPTEVIRMLVDDIEAIMNAPILKSLAANLDRNCDDIVIKLLKSPRMNADLMEAFVVALSKRNMLTPKIIKAVCSRRATSIEKDWQFQHIVEKCGTCGELPPSYYKKIIEMSTNKSKDFMQSALYRARANDEGATLVREIMLSPHTPKEVYEEIKKNVSSGKDANNFKMLIAIHEFGETPLTCTEIAKQIKTLTPMLTQSTVYYPATTVEYFMQFEQLMKTLSETGRLQDTYLHLILDAIQNAGGNEPALASETLMDVCIKYGRCGHDANKFFDMQFGKYAPELKMAKLAMDTKAETFLYIASSNEYDRKTKAICHYAKLIDKVIRDADEYQQYVSEMEAIQEKEDEKQNR